jgi:DNA repair exonuclease SbcCD nuclease subunit
VFKFLHAADVHLDSPLQKLEQYEGAPVRELRQATRRAFENLIELAIAERVDFVLIAGDLYDGDWKDYNTGLYFVSRITKLRDAGIPVYIITGNHDAANTITKTLRLPDGVYVFPTDKPGTFYLQEQSVAIHGQGFATPAVKKDLAAGYPAAVPGYYNIGMLHTCATGREGHEPYAPCTVTALESKGYDYWALGHVHQQEILCEDPLIVFPGNIQGRHIRESGTKGCMLVTVDEKGRADAQFRRLDVIRWARCEISASEAEDAYAVIDAISEKLIELLEESEGLALIVRIEVIGASLAHGDLAGDPDRWTNEIRSAAIDLSQGRIWIEKVKLGTISPSQRESSTLSSGPMGEILRCLDEIGSDPDRLQSLSEPLDLLIKKLPRELKEGPDAISPNSHEWLSGILEEVRAMLLRRLLSKGDSQ